MSDITNRWREAVSEAGDGTSGGWVRLFRAGDALAAILDRIEKVAEDEADVDFAGRDAWREVLRIIREGEPQRDGWETGEELVDDTYDLGWA